MADTNRHEKTLAKWQKIAESFGYKSEKELFLGEFKDKNVERLAKMCGYSAQTIRYRVLRCGIPLYDEKVFICGVLDCGRPCTPPNKHVCDYHMQTDIELGYEYYG